MTDTNYFHKKLEEERVQLEEQLQDLGRVNPQNPDDWEPTPDTSGNISDDPDPNVAADAVEEFGTRSATEGVLEQRLASVKEALERIEAGTYGTCASGGEPIEKDRLEANPAATTCKNHMEDDDQNSPS